MPSRADILRTVPLFANLSRGDRELIARFMDDATYPAGSTLIKQDLSNHMFFVLVDGEADVDVSGQPRRTLRRGDFFGEISMHHRIPATATIVARTPLLVYVMSHEQFGALRTTPEVFARLQAAIGERLANDRAAPATIKQG